MSAARLVSLVLGGGSQSAFNSILALLLTRWLGVHDRGAMVTVVAIVSIAALFSTLGVPSVYRVSAPRAGTSPVRAYAFLCLLLPLGSGVVSAGACWIWIASGDGGPTQLYLAGAFVAGIALALQPMCWDAWYAMGRYREGSIWAACSSMVALLVCLVASPFLQSGASFLIAQMATLVAVTLVSFIRMRFRGFIGSPGAVGAAGKMVRGGFHFLSWSASLSVLTRVDRIALGVFDSMASAAIYGLAVTYVEAWRMVTNAAAQLLLSRADAASDGFKGRRSLLVVASVPVAGGLAFAPLFALIVDLAFPAAYKESVYIACLLLVGEAGFGVFLMSSRWLQGGGHPRTVGRLGQVMSAGSAVTVIVAASLGGLWWTAIAVSGCFVVTGVFAYCLVRRIEAR